MNIVERAKDIAIRAHAGQVDKAGLPYIEHVSRVAAAVSGDPEAEAVAWLHDVLEDCGRQFDERVFGLHRSSMDVVGAVLALTRIPNENSEHYYAGIRKNPLALRVKLADIADNADESRLALLDDETSSRLRKKYAKAMRILAERKQEQPE